MQRYSRADFLKVLINNKDSDSSISQDSALADNGSGLKKISSGGIGPYKGAWGQPQIMHLLRRTLFGVSMADYNYFSAMTLAQCVKTLLTPSATPLPPVNNYTNNMLIDPYVPFGQTWVNAPYGPLPIGVTVANRNSILNSELRRGSLKSWWVSLMFNQDRSITEKMTLFLHNSIATQIKEVLDSRYSYKHVALLRSYALGNFRKLARDITIDPQMLVYLNGNSNIATAPNENYARELQELFFVGKGRFGHQPFSESDVQAAARVLTGWTDNFTTVTSTDIGSSFVPANHDTGDKTFSAFYNNTVITGRSGTAGAKELDAMLDMIFTSPQSRLESAKFLCRRLYRFFVYYVIDDVVEANVIAPLAQVVMDNDFELAPVLNTLLSSEHFYDPINMGCLIKNPFDAVLGTCRQFNVVLPSSADLVSQYNAWELLYNMINPMADLGDPPSVEGWPAYSSAPIYHELWLNSFTLELRNEWSDFLGYINGYTNNGVTLKFDFLAFTATLSDPSDPNQLITDSTTLLSAAPFGAKETAHLKSLLLSGLQSDSYWTEAWQDYVNDPNNTTYSSVVQNRLLAYYKYLLDRPEYQLS